MLLVLLDNSADLYGRRFVWWTNHVVFGDLRDWFVVQTFQSESWSHTAMHYALSEWWHFICEWIFEWCLDRTSQYIARTQFGKEPCAHPCTSVFLIWRVVHHHLKMQDLVHSLDTTVWYIGCTVYYCNWLVLIYLQTWPHECDHTSTYLVRVCPFPGREGSERETDMPIFWKLCTCLWMVP